MPTFWSVSHSILPFFFVSFCDFPSSNKLKLPLLHGVWLACSPDFSDIFKGNRKENFQHFPPPFP